ncbi:MAG: fibronectin type III domain-containing protein, partial [Bacteroidota bacterium]
AYIVQYRPVTTPESAWTTVTTTDTGFVVSSLTCGTAYQWHVASSCGNSLTSNLSVFSANINFNTAACIVPCNPPTGLTTANITTTGATLNWQASSAALAYVVQYRPVTVPESAWINVNATTNTIVLSNLTCGTQYEWHVAAYCNTTVNGLSAYSTIINFTTAACVIPCNPPTGLNTTNITTIGAKFNWAASSGANAYIVQYRPVTTPESAWTTVTTTDTSFTISTLTCGTSYQWHVASSCGTTSTNNSSAFSAIINFTTAACVIPCNPPTGLTTTNITTTGATLNWIASTNLGAYVVQYRPVTFPESAWINVTATTNTMVLSNLACGTNYQWYVAAYCSNTGTSSLSAYSAIINFTTAACIIPCNPPTGLTTSNITTTGAKFNWAASSGANAYIVQYRPVTTPESTWTTVTSTDTSYVLSTLTCGTAYQWHVASVCGTTSTNNSSAFSAIINFNTAACVIPCNPPTGLTTTNITTTSATLNWIASTNFGAYIIQYRPVTVPESAWINVTATTNTMVLSNLACGTTYQWHVAAYCSSATGSLSSYSTTINFTTGACVTPCNPPTGLTTTNITTTGATLNWIATTGVGAYAVQYRPVTVPESAWINVTATTNTMVLSNLACGTNYQWYVAAYCSNSGSSALSAYSTIINFTTLACSTPCNPPTGLNTTTITTTGAKLNWLASSGIAAYLVQYRPVTTPESAWISLTATTNTMVLSNLTCGTPYQWHVASICGTAATNISNYSTIINFTTLPCIINACAAPTGLYVSNVATSITSKMLNWNSTNALLYNIRYRKVGTAAYTTITSNVNSKLITGLQAGQYEWQVQSVCSTSSGVASVSAWSMTATFNASLSNIFPNPANTSMVHLNVISEQQSIVNVSILNQYGNVVKKYDQTIMPGLGGFDIDVANLTNGIYYVQFTGEVLNEMQKIVIMK